MNKTAFTLMELPGIMHGIGTGIPIGRNVAGHVSDATAPEDAKEKAHAHARTAGTVGAPLGALAALRLGLQPAGQAVQKLLAKQSPTVRMIGEMGTPLALGLAGSAAGGALAGGLTGAAHHLKKKEASIAFYSEIQKLGMISDEQANESVHRLETLERAKPTAGQMGRYAGLGALTAPALGLAASAITKKPYVHSGGSVGRVLAGDALKGAVGMGAVPLLRNHMDRQAEAGTIKKYLKEHETGAPTVG